MCQKLVVMLTFFVKCLCYRENLHCISNVTLLLKCQIQVLAIHETKRVVRPK